MTGVIKKIYIGKGIRTIDPESVYTLLLQQSTTRSGKYPKIHKEVQILTFWSNVHTPNEKMLQFISRIYASNKNYTGEIYSPILCDVCEEKCYNIFVYDNYNNMKNMLKTREYTKLIFVLGGMLMVYYFYVNLKIKQKIYFCGIF